MNPYIGITGFTTSDQVREMLAVFNRHRPEHSLRQLHVGVMMNYEMLHRFSTKWATVFPRNEAIAEIFCSDDTYNCLHYADYDNCPGLCESLVKAIHYGGIGIHALQLDMPWPEPSEIANAIHISRVPLEVILQIGGVALDRADNHPKVVMNRLAAYEGIIDRVLLDKSMGRGLSMNATLVPLAQAIRACYPELGLSIAGGLGPTTMHLAQPFIEAVPDVSVDAQAQLCPDGNAMNPTNWTLAAEYLRQALAVLP